MFAVSSNPEDTIIPESEYHAGGTLSRMLKVVDMENSVDYVTVHSNRQELRVLERTQDVVHILTSPDRGFEKKVAQL